MCKVLNPSRPLSVPPSSAHRSFRVLSWRRRQLGGKIGSKTVCHRPLASGAILSASRPTHRSKIGPEENQALSEGDDREKKKQVYAETRHAENDKKSDNSNSPLKTMEVFQTSARWTSKAKQAAWQTANRNSGQWPVHGPYTALVTDYASVSSVTVRAFDEGAPNESSYRNAMLQRYCMDISRHTTLAARIDDTANLRHV